MDFKFGLIWNTMRLTFVQNKDGRPSDEQCGDADNRKINANFKKGGFIGYQTFVHLMKCVHDKKNATEESGKNLYLFVAFFLTNSIASYPPFLKLRLSLMRQSVQKLLTSF